MEIYNPTQKEIEARKWAYDAFEIMWTNQTKSYPQFNNQSLQSYLDEGRQAINLKSEAREDGRSNIKSAVPLNKLQAILARVALNRPKIEVDATTKANILDKKRGEVIKDLFYWSENEINVERSSDVDYFFDALNAQADGTVLKYEGYDNQVHKVKTITEYNPDTGEVKWNEEEVKNNRCFSATVLPEEFFIWNPYIGSLQRQPKVCWRTEVDLEKFEDEFKGYKRAKFVRERDSVVTDYLIQSYYKEAWENRVDKKKVEILRIYSRTEDRMVIIANGVVLQDSPLVFQNGKPKKYPFAYTVNNFFAGGEFFWGMHLWHKLKGDVSALDTLYNLGIEQEKLVVNPPQLTTSENEVEDLMLFPGRQLVVDDINNFKELTFKSPDQSYFNFIEHLGKRIDFSSLDPASQGQNVAGTTARGQVIAEENARKLLSQFNMMMESLVLQYAKLRVPNIIQFHLVPNSNFRVNTEIDGQAGVREISVVGTIQEAKTPNEIEMIEKMAELYGINLEKLYFTPEYLKNCEYSIKIIGESAFQQGKSLQIALELEKQGTIAKLFPNIFQSASELFFMDLMRAYDNDPNKYLEAVKKNVQQNAMQMMQQAGEQSKLVGQMTGSKEMGSEMGLPKLSGVE